MAQTECPYIDSSSPSCVLVVAWVECKLYITFTDNSLYCTMNLLVVVWVECKLYITFTDNSLYCTMNLLVVVWVECKLYVTFTDNTKVIGDPHSSLSQHEIPLGVCKRGGQREGGRKRGEERGEG